MSKDTKGSSPEQKAEGKLDLMVLMGPFELRKFCVSILALAPEENNIHNIC